MKIPSKAKLVGVNLRRWPFQPALTQKAKRILARTVRHLAARYRAHFIVLPFNRSPKELQLARQFAKLAPAGRVHVLPYDQTPPELKGLCKGLDLMIAMRLHASILAAAAGTPAIGLVYDPKVSRFFHDLNLPNMCASVSQASAEALTAKAETLLAHPEKWRSRFLHGVRNLQKREEGNLHTLKALIQNSA